MLVREGYHIRNNVCVNKRIEGRTQKEWCEDNKEKLTEYHKEWEKDNEEKRTKQRKEYNDNNKEKRAKFDKERYERDKEKVSKRSKEKVSCPFCSKIMNRGNLYYHKKNTCPNKHN